MKYAGQAQLNPFTSSGRASMALLEELIAAGAVAPRQLILVNWFGQ